MFNHIDSFVQKYNRPIYPYSSMALRLSGQTSISDGVVRKEVSLEEMLQAARKEIDRLEQELDRKKNITQFGLGQFMYDDEMIQFYTGFSSSNVL